VASQVSTNEAASGNPRIQLSQSGAGGEDIQPNEGRRGQSNDPNADGRGDDASVNEGVVGARGKRRRTAKEKEDTDHVYVLYSVNRTYQRATAKVGMMSAPLTEGLSNVLSKNISR